MILSTRQTHDDTVLDGVGDTSSDENSSTELADGGGQASLLHSERLGRDRGREGVGDIVGSDICCSGVSVRVSVTYGPPTEAH